MEIKKIIKGEVVVLDYADIRNTRMEECKLVYRGGRPPILIGNEFIRCEWIFEHEAENTLGFLHAIATSGGGDLVLSMVGLKPNDR